MVAALRDAVRAIREDNLGFKSEQVGTHYQRSWSAMAMYLGECPVYTIMMIGKWSSHAFLRYIRNKSSNLVTISLAEWFVSSSTNTSLIWNLQCLTYTPDEEITRKNLREEEILVIICQGVSVSLPCLCTTEWTEARPEMLEFVDGENIFAPKGFGRREKL